MRPDGVEFGDETHLIKKSFKEIEIKSKKLTNCIGAKALCNSISNCNKIGQDLDGKGVTVEQFALNYYSRQGWKGLHTENSIVTTLFALLFWDILFLDVPGVFNSKYQTSPLDLGSICFYESRKQEISNLLQEIRNGTLQGNL